MKELSDAEDIETRLVRANGKGTTLKTSALKLFTVANLYYIINFILSIFTSELRHNDKKEMPMYFESKR